MSDGRSAILSAIRAAAVPPAEPASIHAIRTTPVDTLAQFLETLPSVGATGAIADDDHSEESWLAQWFPRSRDGVLVVRGQCAVAENGAVFVHESALPSRAALVLAEHVVVIVSARTVVATMHDAMHRLDANGCEWFLSGPSKTADIEQSLVIGAQGSRTMHVIVKAAS